MIDCMLTTPTSASTSIKGLCMYVYTCTAIHKYCYMHYYIWTIYSTYAANNPNVPSKLFLLNYCCCDKLKEPAHAFSWESQCSNSTLQ